jgi:CheY-like chemotaxis protein
MIPLRILHVDDEPDIREIVELSLGLDPTLAVHTCASGGEALRAVDDWPPDLILLDVMMPGMDGPTALARLRGAPQTADIPVVFMTARAQARELEHFRSLGAAGVIAKPFDPLTLAGMVRQYAPAAEARRAVLRDSFITRARADARALADLRPDLTDETSTAVALDGVGAIAHALAGSAGIFGFHGIGIDAAALEDAVAMTRAGNGSLDEVVHTVDCVLARIEADLETRDPGNGCERYAASASDNGASDGRATNGGEPSALAGMSSSRAYE